MKYKSAICTIGISLWVLTSWPNIRAQDQNLRERIKSKLGLVHGFPYQEFDKLGTSQEIRNVLMEMLSEFWNTPYEELSSVDEFVFGNVINQLGRLREKRAVPILSKIFLDKAHENQRYFAIRALGQIDADGNKQLLLMAIDLDSSESAKFWEPALEGLALTRTPDPAVAEAVERYRATVTSDYVKEICDRAIRHNRPK